MLGMLSIEWFRSACNWSWIVQATATSARNQFRTKTNQTEIEIIAKSSVKNYSRWLFEFLYCPKRSTGKLKVNFQPPVLKKAKVSALEVFSHAAEAVHIYSNGTSPGLLFPMFLSLRCRQNAFATQNKVHVTNSTTATKSESTPRLLREAVSTVFSPGTAELRHVAEKMQPTDQDRREAILRVFKGEITQQEASGPAYGVSTASMWRHLRPLLVSAMASLIGASNYKGLAKNGRQAIADELAALLTSRELLPTPVAELQLEDSDLEEDDDECDEWKTRFWNHVLFTIV
jgi:hypothetical protein